MLYDYIANNTQCLNEFILTNENETQFNISIYNPNLQGINLISIEFNYTKNRFNLKEKISEFYCLNNIKNVNYVNNCFLNFFWNFDKNVNLIHLTIQKVSIENRPLMNLNQFIKYEIPKNRKKNNNKIILYENTKLIKEVSLNIVNTTNSTNLFFHVEYWNYN